MKPDAAFFLLFWFLGPAVVCLPLVGLSCMMLFSLWRDRHATSYRIVWIVLLVGLFVFWGIVGSQIWELLGQQRAIRRSSEAGLAAFVLAPYVSAAIGVAAGLSFALFWAPPRRRNHGPINPYVYIVLGMIVGILLLVLIAASGLD